MRYGKFVLLTLCLAVIFGVAGSGGVVAAQREGSLEGEFEAAAKEYGVPKDLLEAMGYVNTRWESPPPGASDYEKGDLEARGSYGIMALVENPSEDTLGEASRLTGLPEEELKTDRAANVLGGAAVLSDIQGKDKPADINGWYDAVAKYGGSPLYANQVYGTLKKGASATISTGERVELAPHPEAETREAFTSQAAADYGRATYYGAHSNNYTNASRGPAQINKIVIHVTQGSWSSALNWFNNGSAQVSAHYTVRSSDGKIGQSVREQDIAYHAGNWTYNQTSIGIEHEGYVSESRWFTDAMYRSSARLSAYLAKKHGIPMDRQHIVGHNQVPGATHTDPGRYWNWDKYMRLVKSYAGAQNTGTSPSPAAYTQVVDNTSERFNASGAWEMSSYNPQRYGENYRYASPKGVNDPAGYRIRIPERGRYTFSARWPASSGYNSSTRYKIKTPNGWVESVRNQRINGGRWVSLGTFDMRRGRTYVLISRKSPAEGYIIADAVRVVRR